VDDANEEHRILVPTVLMADCLLDYAVTLLRRKRLFLWSHVSVAMGMAKSVSSSLPGSTSDSETYERERIVDAEKDEDDQSICYSR